MLDRDLRINCVATRIIGGEAAGSRGNVLWR